MATGEDSIGPNTGLPPREAAGWIPRQRTEPVTQRAPMPGQERRQTMKTLMRNGNALAPIAVSPFHARLSP